MSTISILVPIPPSANHLFKSLRTGRRARTQAYTAWAEEAGYAVRTAWRAGGCPKVIAPLRLTINAGIGRHRDVSNVIKPIEDLLVDVIPGLPDDRFNDEVRASRDPSLPTNMAMVTIESVAPA